MTSLETLIDLHQRHVLRVCRAVMPGLSSVVLATEDGLLLAHESLGPSDAEGLARRGAQQRADQGGDGGSALVSAAGGLHLVVFVPPPLAHEWGGGDGARMAAPAAAAPQAFSAPAASGVP